MKHPAVTPPSAAGSVEGIVWPPISGRGTTALGQLVNWLQSSQWLTAEELQRSAFRQLAVTAAHCQLQSPHFNERLRKAHLSPADLATAEGFAALPQMTRREIQLAGKTLFCREVPQSHGAVYEAATSGSTGEPVHVRQTEVGRLIWYASAIRDHLWYRRDFSLPFMSVRLANQGAVDSPTWGPPVSLLFESGPGTTMSVRAPVADQAAKFRAFKPGVFLTFPNNLALLIDELEKTDGPRTGLRHLRTGSETVTPALRRRANDFFGLDIEDAYATGDAGLLAIQCPECREYHAMSESFIIEILDESNSPCAPGATGRVVITELLNFATPLIRYEIGDYAIAGGRAPCGRGLTTFRSIVGRERNLMLLPNGSRRWPTFGSMYLRDVAPVRQCQAIQTDRQTVHLNLVIERPLDQSEEAAVRRIVAKALGHPFTLVLDYRDTPLPRAANGKFEDFICRAV